MGSIPQCTICWVPVGVEQSHSLFPPQVAFAVIVGMATVEGCYGTTFFGSGMQRLLQFFNRCCFDSTQLFFLSLMNSYAPRGLWGKFNDSVLKRQSRSPAFLILVALRLLGSRGGFGSRFFNGFFCCLLGMALRMLGLLLRGSRLFSGGRGCSCSFCRRLCISLRRCISSESVYGNGEESSNQGS